MNGNERNGKLKNIVNDLVKIKEYYYWISYYSRVELEDKVNFYIQNIDKIYKKYSVKNYKDLIEFIKNLYSNSKIEKDLNFCKNILFLIKSPEVKEFTNTEKLMPYDDSIFKEIYKHIIINNLYNPNWNIGVSEEPLFVMLPIVSDLFEINMLVYENKNIDWFILSNGSDAFMRFVYFYLNSKDETLKEYYFNIIKTALNRIDNIDETIRYKSEERIVKYEVQSLRQQILNINDDELNALLEKSKNK